jgi:hypothetical protein
VMLVVLVNLILTIALITQVREVQQRVAGLPSAAGSPDPEPKLCAVP